MYIIFEIIHRMLLQGESNMMQFQSESSYAYNNCTFGLAPPIHFTYCSFWDGAAGHWQLNCVDVVCRKCRPGHVNRKYKAWLSTPPFCLTHTHILYIPEILFHSTHLDSRTRAKLEPSGPHMTWAMLTSCLPIESGGPSCMSETPSHTRYSLSSGTLQRHRKGLNSS